MPLAASERKQPSALPEISCDHEFVAGDLVSMPRWREAPIVGVLTHIDIIVGEKRYNGLVVLGEDRRYYEFHPEIATKISDKERKKDPA
jgi:hypothetical protein